MTAMQDRIEALLRHHHGRTVTREELYRHVWVIEPSMGVRTRTLEVHICHLRKKLPPGERIDCHVGVGYRLVRDESVAA